MRKNENGLLEDRRSTRVRFLHESEVQSLLRKYSIRPSKDRGQSFLTSLSVTQNIVNAANLVPEDIVLEIGGGLGILSQLLAKEVNHLYVIEIEESLVHVLSDRLSELPNVTLIHDDALTTDLPAVTKIVANLPYSVASEITFRLLNEASFEVAILMYQKEFADRLLANPGSSGYSRLSIDFQYLGTAEHVLDVKAEHFYPRPKVDSSVLAIRKRGEGVFAKNAEVFFWVVHGIYSYPNKQLKKALGIWFNLLKCPSQLDLLVERLESGIDLTTRLRSLHLSDLVYLSDVILELVEEGILPDPRG